jgi:Poly(A) polymerase catalytic subunit
MEEDIHDYGIKSTFLKRPSVQKQLELLKSVAKEAEDIIEVESANNPEIRYALGIIERFLVKKKRVCYGGTAINALLPKSLKFYDSEKDLPDYDFFTPDPEADIKGIVHDLEMAGFTEVVERIGMHEGTHKILVNYIPVADITAIDPTIYRNIYERSIPYHGIHYADPDFLRMMMYLELSRPRGEVARWEKVFERLTLLNGAFPIRACKASTESIVGSVHIPFVIRKALLEYVLEKQRILVGADVVILYDWLISNKKYNAPSIQWFLKKNGMMVFFSPEAARDGLELKRLFGPEGITIETMRGGTEIIPQRTVVSFRGMPFVMIVQETACHSYTTISLSDGKKLKIGSLETMITLYFALAFFTQDEKILGFLMFCLSQKLVEMSEILHKMGGKGPIPAFSIECSGYQKGYATLLREKVARIAREKKKRRGSTQRVRLHKGKRTRRNR